MTGTFAALSQGLAVAAPKAQLNGALAAYPELTDRLSGSTDMTDPLLWLDGDPTDGRRARPHEPEPAARHRSAARSAARAAARRGGHFRSALAGGLVSALLVGGGAFALGVARRRRPRTQPR